MPTPEQIRARYQELLAEDQNLPASSIPKIGFPKSKPTSEQIRARYQELTQQETENIFSPQTQEESINPPTFFGSLKKDLGELTTGAAKGALSTVKGISNLGNKLIVNPVLSLTGQKTQKELPAESLQAAVEQKLGLKPGQLTTPEGALQKVGFGAEQIGEFFIPGLREEKGAAIAGKLAGKIPGLAKKAPVIVEKVAPFLGRSATMAADTALRTAAQTGGDMKATSEAGLIGGLTPTGILALKGLSKAAGTILKGVASVHSGVPFAAIEHAVANPESTQRAIRVLAKEGDMAPTKVAETFESAFGDLKDIRRAEYKANLQRVQDETFLTKDGQLYVKREITPKDVREGLAPKEALGRMDSYVPTKLTLGGIKNKITTTLKDFNIGSEAGLLDFERSALTKSHHKDIQELVDRVYSWKDISPQGLDDLREIIGSYRKGGINLGSGDAKFNAVVERLKSNLSSYVGERVPQIRKLNLDYHVASDFIDSIKSELSLGKEKQGTVVRKILNLFNPKSVEGRRLIERLGQKTAADLKSEAAGLVMARLTPEGLAKYLAGAELASGQFLALPFTSPRIIGEIATGFGKAVKSKGVKVLKRGLPKAIRGAISQTVRPTQNSSR